MSYQVLARKWRPRRFEDLVGQTHVVRALSNALTGDRLHHAYLFSGTRGVGKTTVARILARALNCETGVTAEPCGQCSACREIDEGRFIDLIEVDAASRTKVDETRELLENVQYAPSRGRYKVYLIDEVHMFSNHSFNALLKTLEEPPPHVKFLLATTDPKKLPVTVLSRCLQFNLKRLGPEEIQGQLARITAAEGVAAEPAALELLARAADGSVRDSLSLLDQAIAHGSGVVETAAVTDMLGTIDRGRVLDLAEALVNADLAGALALVANAHALGIDADIVLVELSAVLQNMALVQALGEAAPVDADSATAARIADLAGRASAEDCQLWYQTAITGRRDLPLAPNPRLGLEMTLLRMLVFRPQEPDTTTSPPAPAGDAAGGLRAARAALGAGSANAAPRSGAAAARAALLGAGPAAAAPAPTEPATAPPRARRGRQAEPASGPAPADFAPAAALDDAMPAWLDDDPDGFADAAPAAPAAPATHTAASALPASGDPAPADPPTPAAVPAVSVTVAPAATAPATASQSAPAAAMAVAATDVDWCLLSEHPGLQGLVRELAQNCLLAGETDGEMLLLHDAVARQLRNREREQRLAEVLASQLGRPVRLAFREVASMPGETPVARQRRLRAEREAEAARAIAEDPNVQAICRRFDARIEHTQPG